MGWRAEPAGLSGRGEAPDPTPAPSAVGVFDLGLAGRACRLDRAGASATPLPVQRWRADAGRSDRWLLERCQGPTVDLGCGPGRLVVALTERGVPALGVDSSTVAIKLCTSRGAVALRRDVFGALPGEGRWDHALLADGNVGIGGNPVALLCRARQLLNRHGSVLVELARHPGLWRGSARLVGPDGRPGGWFPWAQVGRQAIHGVAESAGLRLCRVEGRRRVFAELRPHR
ncbi:MAG TPA: class I SAM-dependent methyltransferase [Pseudonocardia sp.]|jgi:SAM-dependent methyltransferase|uniref:class I SAM-dependent methyltransferase n=1 Tax=Pseudonocardia sp. TaxID=60912 RepID=UPI002F3F9616